MQTQIDIDDELFREARELAGLANENALVDAGLRALIRWRRQEILLEIPPDKDTFWPDCDPRLESAAAARVLDEPGEPGVSAGATTSVEISSDLLRIALDQAGLDSERESVEAGLRVLLDARAREDILDLAGQVEFWPGYDHKAMRRAE
jgi:Arc/MetJ family transcription regulator